MQISASKAEIAELKGLNAAEREESEKRILILEASLEKEREGGGGGAASLRGELDNFMSQVARLSMQVMEEGNRREEVEALCKEKDVEIKESMSKMARLEGELGELGTSLKASESTLKDYQVSMESQLVEKRREAREGDGGSRQEALDSVRFREVPRRLTILRKQHS